MKTYIHFGNDKFDPELFRSVKNEKYFDKPEHGTGFWASPLREDGTSEWIDYLENNDLSEKIMHKYFEFTLKEDTNLVLFEKVRDFVPYQKYLINYGERCITQFVNDGIKPYLYDEDGYLKSKYIQRFAPTMYFDFEQMVKDGIDAIEIDLTTRDSQFIYYSLYGWDVSSILIMNKDCIITM